MFLALILEIRAFQMAFYLDEIVFGILRSNVVGLGVTKECDTNTGLTLSEQMSFEGETFRSN